MALQNLIHTLEMAQAASASDERKDMFEARNTVYCVPCAYCIHNERPQSECKGCRYY
jgi:hypothetical protein